MKNRVGRAFQLPILLSLMFTTVAVYAVEAVPVVVTKVAKQSVLQEVLLTGTVTSAKSARLSVSTAGLVATLDVDEGDYVKAGQPLMSLDNELVKLQWQSSAAAVVQARVAFDDAQRRLQESTVLAKQKNIAATTVKDREAEVASNRAALEKAQATAAYQKALLARHTLLAPFAGVIAEKSTELGEWVTPGTGVYSLVSTDNLRLDFSVAETYLSKIALDADVRFTVAGIPGQEYHGSVQTIVPVTDPNARTFLLRVAVTHESNRASLSHSSVPLKHLLPGMSVQAKLAVPTGTEGLVVPRDAILRYPDSRTVVWEAVAGDAGLVVEERVVKLGASYDGFVEVISGLSVGADVVVKGNEVLHHGQLVTLVQ